MKQHDRIAAQQPIEFYVAKEETRGYSVGSDTHEYYPPYKCLGPFGTTIRPW